MKTFTSQNCVRSAITQPLASFYTRITSVSKKQIPKATWLGSLLVYSNLLSLFSYRRLGHG